MSVNQPPKKEVTESTVGSQPYLLWFAVSIAIALIVLPLLPGLISNLVYSFHSFGGKAPKIYWYLSRASGFVSFTILWISMALGLGITNKMARLWPGAPSAFAVHQYTSMLGLAFAAYHGLVLMGDHFVDFSLPRLLTPFSIAYKTNWIGLGQVCFYIWLAVVLSFYVRQKIGQKTWRMIHYVNFVIYVMGFLHGYKSGTDSNIPWVVWYFWISAATLVLLLAYRIHESFLKARIPLLKEKVSLLKDRISCPKFLPARVQAGLDTTLEPPTQPSISTRLKNLPLALLRSQLKKTTAFLENERVIQIDIEVPMQPSANETVVHVQQQPTPETVEPLLSDPTVNTPAAVSEVQEPEGVRRIVDGSGVRLEGTYQGKPIRVRILGEPTTKPIPSLQDSDEIKLPEKITLLIKLKNRFRGIPVEPATPDQRSERIVFLGD